MTFTKLLRTARVIAGAAYDDGIAAGTPEFAALVKTSTLARGTELKHLTAMAEELLAMINFGLAEATERRAA